MSAALESENRSAVSCSLPNMFNCVEKLCFVSPVYAEKVVEECFELVTVNMCQGPVFLCLHAAVGDFILLYNSALSSFAPASL